MSGQKLIHITSLSAARGGHGYTAMQLRLKEEQAKLGAEQGSDNHDMYGRTVGQRLLLHM